MQYSVVAVSCTCKRNLLVSRTQLCKVVSLCASKCIDNAQPIDAISFRKVLVGVDKLKECLVTTPSLRCLLLGVIKS